MIEERAGEWEKRRGGRRKRRGVERGERGKGCWGEVWVREMGEEAHRGGGVMMFHCCDGGNYV